MTQDDVAVVEPVDQGELPRALRDAGARFALLHGSRVRGTAHAGLDTDVAAWWGRDALQAFEVLLSPGADLLVLDRAPLELAGRVALEGRVLFDDDPVARVRWTAHVRKVFGDEQPRLARSRADFVEAVLHGR